MEEMKIYKIMCYFSNFDESNGLWIQIKWCKNRRLLIRETADWNGKYYDILQIVRGGNFYDDYFKMIHKVAYDSKHGKGFKILTSKRIFQRLPTFMANNCLVNF